MAISNKIHTLLLPLSVLYGAGVYFRNKLFDWKLLPSERFATPVICVGNITVGGTGKTPHIEYLVRLLTPHYRVAVLSRGYKRHSKGFQLADSASTPTQLGDESYQLHRKFPELIVAVDADRRNGIRHLEALPVLPQVILLDDAYQHRYVSPGLTLLLTDFNRMIDRDHLLPAGRMRESIHGTQRASMAIITKAPREISDDESRLYRKRLRLREDQPLFFSGLSYSDLKPVFISPDINEGDSQPKEKFHLGKTALLVTGIAQPALFERYLSTQYELAGSLVFPDHHDFQAHDIQKITDKFHSIPNKEKLIIVTEKDAVRLQHNPFIDDSLKKNMYFSLNPVVESTGNALIPDILIIPSLEIVCNLSFKS